MPKFQVVSAYQMAGDQPVAVEAPQVYKMG